MNGEQRSSPGIWRGVFLIGDAFVKVLNTMGQILAVIAVLTVVAITLSLNWEVFARYVLRSPTKWAWELVAYFSVAVIFLPMAEVLRQNKHIRITILLDRLSPRGRAIWYAIGALFALVWSGLLTWHGGAYALEAFQMNMRSESVLGVPLFLPIALIPLGAGLFSIQLIVQIGKRLLNPEIEAKGKE